MKFCYGILCLVMLTGCDRNYEVETVELYEFDGFGALGTEYISSVEDSSDVAEILSIFEQAEQAEVIVDMAEGDYSLHLISEDGEQEGIHLWLEGESGSMMEMEDTHTLYTFSEAETADLKEALAVDLAASASFLCSTSMNLHL